MRCCNALLEGNIGLGSHILSAGFLLNLIYLALSTQITLSKKKNLIFWSTNLPHLFASKFLNIFFKLQQFKLYSTLWTFPRTVNRYFKFIWISK
jgi:hypothetical protein